ncbi:putative membrane protein [Frigoribacterium sp. PvP054]|uniref:DoxX family protein n=1 Tax=Frigoribacterium sp. PvP054 TaxID=3156438 RepID=UPI003399758B
MSHRPRRPPRSAARRDARVLAAILGGSGVLHLARPAVYDAVVPRSVPGPARFWTIGAGLAEVGIAVALLSPRTRRAGGLAAAALFVAVFPANVSMALRAVRSERATTVRRAVTIARLPLQVPLVTRALGVHRAS